MKNGFILKLILQITVYMVIMAALFFVLAGTLAWPRVWVFLGLFYLGMVAMVIHLERTDHDLLVERAKRREKGQPVFDKIILPAFLAASYATMLCIPLDVFHFHLLPKPSWIVSSLGLVIYLAGWGILFLTLKANSFAAVVVKLQPERGHKLIDTGVYRIVRHPMYAGGMLIGVGLPLFLQSCAAALLQIIPIALLALRCVLEEKFLRQNLAGYTDYTWRVRYRMIPFLW